MRAFLLCCVALLATPSLAHTFMPENNLHTQESLMNSDMTKALFEEIVDDAIAEYQADAAKYGARLVGNKLWDNGTVNASANQSGSTWYINMYGGLARRAEVTPDGFALVVCHELGHHLAGFPYYGASWASSEGESDYFATQACARRLWKGQGAKNAEAEDSVDYYAKGKCDQAWRLQADRHLCYRAANAGYSLALLLSHLGGAGDPDFSTPDRNEVSRTSPRHPAGQCRLDTYFAGALCVAKLRDAEIPGKLNPNGQDGRHAENEAAAYSCFRGDGYALGVRPKCWFAPKSVVAITSHNDAVFW